MKDEQGRLMFVEFFGIPLEGSYHRVIKYPMSLDVVEQQLEEGVMTSVNDVISALLLIIENAREYNEEGSPLYKKALKLQKELLCAAPKDTIEPMIHTHRVLQGITRELNKCGFQEAMDGNNLAKYREFLENVECGYYWRLDQFQDDLMYIFFSLLSVSQFSENYSKILDHLKIFINLRYKFGKVQSSAHEFTRETMSRYYAEKMQFNLTGSLTTTQLILPTGEVCTTGDKWLVSYTQTDAMVLLIDVIAQPHWVSGRIYLIPSSKEKIPYLYGIGMSDVVHVKYLKQKLEAKYKVVNCGKSSTYPKPPRPSLYQYMRLARYSSDSILHSSEDKNMTTYLQYERNNGDVFKIGDFVYLKSESELPFIARIDSIQKDRKGVWIHGPWFIRPVETKFYETRHFYPNEVLMSNIQDRNHLNSVEGRCEVLTPKDYTTRAPLGFLSKDIYVCEHKYDEGEHRFSKLFEKSLYTRPERRVVAVEDQIEPLEWYSFERPRSIVRVVKPSFQLPIKCDVIISEDEEDEEEEEEEGGTTSENRETTPEERQKPQQQQPPKMKHKLIKPKPVDFQQEFQPKIIKQQTPKPRREPMNKQQQSSKPRQRNHIPSFIKRVQIVPAGSDLTPIGIPNDTDNIVTPRAATPQTSMLCGWSTCEKQFQNSEEFFRHAINTQTHLRGGEDNPEWKCRWKFCPDETARIKGCQTQILLRRHLMEHLRDSGYKEPRPAKRPQNLKHSETYKLFLKRFLSVDNKQELQQPVTTTYEGS